MRQLCGVTLERKIANTAVTEKECAKTESATVLKVSLDPIVKKRSVPSCAVETVYSLGEAVTVTKDGKVQIATPRTTYVKSPTVMITVAVTVEGSAIAYMAGLETFANWRPVHTPTALVTAFALTENVTVNLAGKDKRVTKPTPPRDCVLRVKSAQNEERGTPSMELAGVSWDGLERSAKSNYATLTVDLTAVVKKTDVCAVKSGLVQLATLWLVCLAVKSTEDVIMGLVAVKKDGMETIVNLTAVEMAVTSVVSADKLPTVMFGCANVVQTSVGLVALFQWNFNVTMERITIMTA